jgi:hypothetical protein
MLNVLMICELEIIWSEMVVALFKIISQHTSGASEENHRNMTLDG